MPNFVYKAIDPSSGRRLSVNISANTQSEANRLIIEQGLRPVSVQRAKVKSLFSRPKRVKRKDRILFTTQLATLINAGLPLLQALRSVAKQVANPELKRIITEINNNIEAGITFSDSLTRYPKIFDPIFVNLVRAGEASGSLDVSLDRLAIQQEKDGAIISKVKSAMIYPVVVILVMVAVVVFMLIVVLPQVETFYAGLPQEKPLPFLTRALLFVSNFIQDYWYVCIIVIFAAVIGVSSWLKTATGRSVADNLKLKLPILKNLYSRVYMARFSRTMGTLFGSGVNLIESLQITKEGLNNVHVDAAIGRSIHLIQEGRPFSDSLRNEEHFLDLIPDMIQIGEQSGKTEEMLLKSAGYYEDEVDKQIKTITTLIEPALILTLGGIAITIVLAVLLPIYDLVNQNLF